MKHWTQPELMELKVSETACGWFPWYPGYPGGGDIIPDTIPVAATVSPRSLLRNRKSS